MVGQIRGGRDLFSGGKGDAVGRTFKASICVALLCAIPSFCQVPAVKAHSPSSEELKILSAAAVSPEFNSGDGPSLRVCLMHSEERECNTGSIGDRALSPEVRAHEPSDLIRPDACAADVVALGRVIGQTSSLSANEATLITLYNFRVQTLYKAKDKTLTGKVISVLRRGGALNSPEGIIRQEDLSVPLLAIGTDYILLLRELSGSGGYVSTTEDLDFKAILSPGTDGKAVSLKGSGRNDIGFDSLTKFQDSLERALAGCGVQQ
jgi:hypothetical protein